MESRYLREMADMKEKMRELISNNEELVSKNRVLHQQVQVPQNTPSESNEITNYKLVFEQKNNKIRELIKENQMLKKEVSVSRRGTEEHSPSTQDPHEKVILNIKEFE